MTDTTYNKIVEGERIIADMLSTFKHCRAYKVSCNSIWEKIDVICKAKNTK